MSPCTDWQWLLGTMTKARVMMMRKMKRSASGSNRFENWCIKVSIGKDLTNLLYVAFLSPPRPSFYETSSGKKRNKAAASFHNYAKTPNPSHQVPHQPHHHRHQDEGGGRREWELRILLKSILWMRQVSIGVILFLVPPQGQSWCAGCVTQVAWQTDSLNMVRLNVIHNCCEHSFLSTLFAHSGLLWP